MMLNKENFLISVYIFLYVSYRSKVWHFLQSFPEFKFNVLEYFLSLTYSKRLKKEFHLFERTLSTKYDMSSHKERIFSIMKDAIIPNVYAYRHLSTMQKFEDIPLIEKRVLRTNPTDFINSRYNVEELMKKDTSGTSGPLVTIRYSPIFYFQQGFLATRKICALAEMKTDQDSQVFSLDISDNPRMNNVVLEDPTGDVGLTLRVAVNLQRQETLDRLVNLINFLRPLVIISKPGLFELIIAKLTKMRIFPTHSPSLIVSGSSALDERVRKETESFFRSKVFNAYGLTEFGMVASECRYQDGLHIDSGSVLVEVLGEDGNTVEDGEDGELVLSSVSNKAMPLLRYRTGDKGSLHSGQCKCGIFSPIIRGISGREVPNFRLYNGEVYSPFHLKRLLYLFPISEFQINQLSPESFEVLVQLDTLVNSTSLLRDIAFYIMNQFPCEIKLTVRNTKFDYHSKFQRYRVLI